jgi:uncharacterized protein (UPF0332 family)
VREEVRVLALHRLTRAREAFAEGEQPLGTNALTGATNRFYCAAFHAPRAFLATREVDSSKHSGVISLFQRHFVRTGVVAMGAAQALPRAFEKRQKTDYGDFSTTAPEEVRQIRAEVQAFVDECARVLDRLATEEA